ncbi:hypothetical protein B8W90_13755, partial [Staphylococcus hominis]
HGQGLEGVRGHARVIAVDVGGIDAEAAELEPGVIVDQELAIGFAQHGVAFLAGFEQQGAVLVIRSVQALGGVA